MNTNVLKKFAPLVLPAGIAGASSGSGKWEERSWSYVEMVEQPLEVFEAERQGYAERVQPATLALSVIDILGYALSVEVRLDRNEMPRTAVVTVLEGAIMDDDLFQVKHELTMLSPDDGMKWAIKRYRTGELRREHYRRAGHPFFRGAPDPER